MLQDNHFKPPGTLATFGAAYTTFLLVTAASLAILAYHLGMNPIRIWFWATALTLLLWMAHALEHVVDVSTNEWLPFFHTSSHHRDTVPAWVDFLFELINPVLFTMLWNYILGFPWQLGLAIGLGYGFQHAIEYGGTFGLGQRVPQHTIHHQLLGCNFAPDYWDAVFGTRCAGKPEDLTRGCIWIVAGVAIALIASGWPGKPFEQRKRNTSIRSHSYPIWRPKPIYAVETRSGLPLPRFSPLTLG